MIARSLPQGRRSSIVAALLTVWMLPTAVLAYGAWAQSGTDATASTTQARAPAPSYLEPLNADECRTR